MFFHSFAEDAEERGEKSGDEWHQGLHAPGCVVETPWREGLLA
jgi:hypothetical protein